MKNLDISVGYRRANLVDEQYNVEFPNLIMYPANDPEQEEWVGKFKMKVSKNAPPKNGLYPLILISHGGGTTYEYRILAFLFTSHGFVVGLPEHPFNCLNNNTLQNSVEILIDRPRHIIIALNWFYNEIYFKGILKPDSASIIGHSMVSCTVLAVVGGIPTSLPYKSKKKITERIELLPDSRVKSIVLLALAAVWFKEEGTLKEVNLPILMLLAEKDEYTHYKYHAQVILDGIESKTRIHHRIIKNAGHFSFLNLFPPNMTTVAFPPSLDPPGFHLGHFLDFMNHENLNFMSHCKLNLLI